jgi:hypothetical protein
MSNPNSALSAWQLATIAVVAVGALAIWLIAVYLAAREPRKRDLAAAAPPADATVAATGSRPAVPTAVTGEGEPAEPARGRKAA